MDFTRQPIIESVITAKEGCKLVVRSSKGTGQEEYFVEAIEVVSFGHSFFFRSLEKPKSFLVPATDYEILEVREARMVLKNVGSNRAIKIAGGRAAPAAKTVNKESESKSFPAEEGKEQPPRSEERRRERRRSSRRRRGGSEGEGEVSQEVPSQEEEREPQGEKELPGKVANRRGGRNPPRSAEMGAGLTSSVLKSLLPPPSTLISETIERYKDNELFRDAFFEQEAESNTLVQSSESSYQEEATQPESAPDND